MIDSQDELFRDLEAVKKIPIVSTMLEVICSTTGMGFAAVARVTKDRWLACGVRDEIQFGLEVGSELKIETTICNEIRDSQQAVVIDHVDTDAFYKSHHTPKLYGLQSYISVPIILKNGDFFGTLCAIDSKPANISDPKIVGTFKMFAELLAFHLDSLILLERATNSYQQLNKQNLTLKKANNELDNFVYTASHDLKSPISNIEGLIDALSDTIAEAQPDKQAIIQIVDLMKASVSRFGITLQDLTTIIKAEKSIDESLPEAIDIEGLVNEIKLDLAEAILKSNAVIQIDNTDCFPIYFSRKNFKSVLYNLISNAIKYRSPERSPEISIQVRCVDSKTNVLVRDNGLGISANKKDQVFTMFKRFHDHVEGTGIGLYIVKRIIDNSNGKIEVQSKVGAGSVFSITL